MHDAASRSASLTGPWTVASEVKAEEKKYPLQGPAWRLAASEGARTQGGGEGGAHPNAEMLQWLWAHTSTLGQAPAKRCLAAEPPAHAPAPHKVSAFSILPPAQREDGGSGFQGTIPHQRQLAGALGFAPARGNLPDPARLQRGRGRREQASVWAFLGG